MALPTKHDNKPPTIVVRKMPMLFSNYKVLNTKLVSEGNVQHLMYKEDIIYEGDGDFLKEKASKIVLFNRSHRLKNISRTIVQCYTGNTVVEKTSDRITNLIGQSNYDTVFSALCSVISQELRIKGILALLTILKKDVVNISCQTDLKYNNSDKKYMDASTQTHNFISQRKKIHNKRKTVMPYIVKHIDTNLNSVNKVIINAFTSEVNHNRVHVKTKSNQNCVEEKTDNIEPVVQEDEEVISIASDFKKELDVNEYSTESEQIDSNIESHKSMNKPGSDMFVYNENSNESIGNISIFSVTTNNSLFNDLSLLNNVNKHTENIDEPGYALYIGDTVIKLRTKPEDNFHLATEENLEYLNPVDRKSLLLYQAGIDFKNCLNRDEDGNMPFHIAVMNNDIDLLKRHCAMLKIKQQSVDTLAFRDYTALKISILKDSPACTNILLRMGADPLQVDDSHRTPLHYAAEESRGCLETLITFCGENARRILQENDHLWKPSYSNESDEQLAKYLLESMCSLCDEQGYTPLMLASQIGNFENAKLLVAAGLDAVNKKMPTSGNTALYLAIAAACSDAMDRGNKTKLSDKYQMTIELLLENGADPSIDNHSGGSVDLLLTELNIPELFKLIANKVTSLRYQGKLTENFDSIMLIKNESGDVNIMNLKSDKSKKSIEIKTAKGSANIMDKNKGLKLIPPICEKIIKKNTVTNKISSVTSASKALPTNIIDKVEGASKVSILKDKVGTVSTVTVLKDKVGTVSSVSILKHKVGTISNVPISKVPNQNSNIKILENIPVKLENSAIQKFANNSEYIVLSTTNNVPISNTISIDNTKTSPVKRTNTKDVKIIHNSNVYYTIDNLNMKIPVLNTPSVIQTSNPNVQITTGVDKKPVIQITKTEKSSIVQNDKTVSPTNLPKNLNNKPVIVESETKPSTSVNNNRKPEFVDTFKNFIRKDRKPNEQNELKRRNEVVIVERCTKVKKIEKE